MTVKCSTLCWSNNINALKTKESASTGALFFLVPGFLCIVPNDRLMLVARLYLIYIPIDTSASDVHKVYWYVNDKFFTAANANQKLFFSPMVTGATPTLKVSSMDDKGRNANIEIRIRFC